MATAFTTTASSNRRRLYFAGATTITLQSAASVWVQPTMDVTKNVTRMTDPTTVGAYQQVKTIARTALVLVVAEHNAAAGDQLMFDWYGSPRPIDRSRARQSAVGLQPR